LDKNKVKSVIGSIFTLILVLLAVYSILGVLNQKKTGELFFFFGYRPVVILSGSMEDTLETGAIAVTKETKDIKEGDIIFFEGEGDVPVIHRCVRIEGDKYYTKGDANAKEDWDSITKDRIYGKVVYRCNAVASIVRNFID